MKMGVCHEYFRKRQKIEMFSQFRALKNCSCLSNFYGGLNKLPKPSCKVNIYECHVVILFIKMLAYLIFNHFLFISETAQISSGCINNVISDY